MKDTIIIMQYYQTTPKEHCSFSHLTGHILCLVASVSQSVAKVLIGFFRFFCMKLRVHGVKKSDETQLSRNILAKASHLRFHHFL